MAAISLLLTSFLIRGHSSLGLPEDAIDELRRWKGESDESETARERDFGGDRDAGACFGGAGIAGRGMLISVYSGSSSFSVSGVAGGIMKDGGSGAAFGVVTAEVEESKSQNGST